MKRKSQFSSITKICALLRVLPTRNAALQLLCIAFLVLLPGLASAQSKRAYVPNAGSSSVSVIDTENNAVLATIAVGAGPTSAAVTPDGSKVYVANTIGRSVSVIDTSTNTVVHTIAVGIAPVWVTVATDGSVYVANAGSNSVSIIDIATDAVVNTIPVGSNPVRINISGGRAYVANAGSKAVSVIDVSARRIISTIAVGFFPTTVELSSAAASGAGGGTPPAQNGNDFSCLGTAAPTTAADPITITGVVSQLDSIGGTARVPAPGILVAVRRQGDDSLLAVASSDSTGHYSVQVPTAGVPLNAYLNFSDPQLLTTRAYISRAFAADTSIGDLALSSPIFLNFIYVSAGLSPSGQTVAVFVRDCAGAAVANAKLNAIPVGQLRYAGSDGFPSSATATTASGLVFLLNQPSSQTAVQAVLNNSILGQVVVNPPTGLTYVILTP